MSLIAIFISLALEKLIPDIDAFRKITWFGRFSDWLCAQLDHFPQLRGAPALLLVILLPVLGIGLIQLFLDDLLLLLGYLFGIAVLTYCLGPRNPLYAVNNYLDAVDENFTETANAALDVALDGNIPDDEDLPETLVNTLLIQTHERILGVLFWFIVLGPIGAVLYRLTVVQAGRERQYPRLDNPQFSATAMQLHELLAWIPCRLTAISYAIMGSFTHALQAWQSRPETQQPEVEAIAVDAAMDVTTEPASHQLLRRVGLGSLQYDHNIPAEIFSVREAFGLCSRSVIAWLTLFAMLTLAGWIL